MAYFSNATEGAALHKECQTCPIGKSFCPIQVAHLLHNYDQIGNKLAQDILNLLVSKDEEAPFKYHGCQMKPLLIPTTPTPSPLVETGRLDPACLPLDHPDR